MPFINSISGKMGFGRPSRSGPPAPVLLLSLDAGNASSYPGFGATWTDLIGGKTFTLNGSPTYSSNDGGYINFVPSSSQYAEASTSLPTLKTWTVEAWHYYTGTNSGGTPSIVTEIYPGGAQDLNYSLGATGAGGNSATVAASLYDLGAGGWQSTNTSYTFPTNNAWYHVVGTYDGTTLKLYLNGSLIDSHSYTGVITTSGGGIRLMRRWESTGYWGGRLAMVRIWRGDIGATNITSTFDSEKSRFGIV